MVFHRYARAIEPSSQLEGLGVSAVPQLVARQERARSLPTRRRSLLSKCDLVG